MNNRIKLAILVVSALWRLPLPAQPTWTQRFGGAGADYAYALAKGADGSLYAGGFSCSPGVWGKYDNWIVKTDAGGQLLWQKPVGGEDNDLLMRLKILPDGRLLALGASDSSPGVGDFQDTINGGWDVKIALLDSAGQLLADFNIGSAGPDWPGDILATTDHHWLVAHSSRHAPDSVGGFDGRLAKTDTLGNILWSKTYGGMADDFFNTITATAGGGYLLGGKSFSPPQAGNGDVWIVKVNAAGEALWEARYGGDEEEWIGGIQPMEDGSFLVAAYSKSGGNGTRNFWLFKINADGGIIWEKTFIAGGDQELNDITPTCNGFLLAGTTHEGSGNGDILVMKIDTEGDSLWSQQIGGSGADIGMAVLAFDDYFVINGSTASTGGVFAASLGLSDYALLRRPYPPGTECISTHDIPLDEGWNLISSYVNPANPDMLHVFGPIKDATIIVKDGAGNVVVPADSINMIGNWAHRAGYQVKESMDTVLSITGNRVPAGTPVPVHAGWQIVAFLRDSPLPANAALAGMTGSLVLAKDNWGNIFMPAYGIDQIGDMIPGRGYWIKAAAEDTLSYPAFSPDPEIRVQAGKEEGLANAQHFVLDPLNTGNNATLIVPAAIAQGPMESGDEIGVFSPEGLLCGAAVYEGENLAATLWGDDPSTPDVVEYLAAGQPFNLRIWKAGPDEEHALAFSLESGAAAYQGNGLYVLSLATGLPQASETAGFRYFPNPATGSLYIGFELAAAARLRIELASGDGKLLAALFDGTYGPGAYSREFGLSEFPSGTYFLRWVTDSGARAYPLVLEKQ